MEHKGSFLVLPNAPAIPGLRFRLYRGEQDNSVFKTVREMVRATERVDWMPGPDTNPDSVCDPLRDCVLIEVDGQVIGFSWLDWWSEVDGTQLYLHLGWIVPHWRHRGLGRALLRWQERRLCEIASIQPVAGPRIFGGNADESQVANRALLLNEGYKVAFTVVEMARQLPVRSVEPFILHPLPEGLELRPVEAEHLPAIYAANDEAFQESRNGYISDSYETFLADLHWPETDTSLWFVAWDGDQVAGLVISEIDAVGGLTPWVAVRRPWRQRGLARALMTHSLHRLQELGVQQARLSTIAENANRTVHLYESVGYQIVQSHPRYRKPMPTNV